MNRIYLAEFQGPNLDLVQGMARFQAPPPASACAARWWQGLREILENRGHFLHPTFAWRLIFHRDSIDRTLLLSGAPGDEPRLREKLRDFTALNEVAAGSVTLPEDRSGYDRLVEETPRLVAPFLATGYTAGEAWLSCRFHVGDWLGELVTAAGAKLNYPVWYQANLWRMAAPLEHWRAARKNLVRLEEVPGLPQALLDRQQKLTDALQHPVIVREEFLAVPDEASAAALTAALPQFFACSEGGFRFEAPSLGFCAEAFSDRLAVGLHRGFFSHISTEEVCAEALDTESCLGGLISQPEKAGRVATVAAEMGGDRGMSQFGPEYCAARPSSNARPDEMAPGCKVGRGRFALVRRLGQGGMGEVWLGKDERLDELVAVKFLPPEIRGNPAALEFLRMETARSHKLTHSHIVRIHDLHEDEENLAFITMEYVDGPTLEELRLQQPGRVLGWEFLRPLVEDLCAALDYAHGEKVIHRDLKPSNIMLDGKGRLKLADFGIAAVISDSVSRSSQRGSTSGTLVYMSPQQMSGKRPQVGDDIYALGATLYELLTGLPPFYTGDIAYQVLNEPPEPLIERLKVHGIENDIPPQIAALAIACLAKEANERPLSAREVVERIKALER